MERFILNAAVPMTDSCVLVNAFFLAVATYRAIPSILFFLSRTRNWKSERLIRKGLKERRRLYIWAHIHRFCYLHCSYVSPYIFEFCQSVPPASHSCWTLLLIHLLIVHSRG